MKKSLKIIVSVILIVLTLFGFVAKYWANGIFPGQKYSGSALINAADQDTRGAFPLCLYESDFGRTVIVWTLDKGSDSFQKLFDLVGKNVILSTQTVKPSIATHLDFFNGLHAPRQFSALVADAGMPTQIDANITSYAKFKTVDGYEYQFRVHRDGLCILTGVADPDGNILTQEQIDALTIKVLVFYLGIAAVLGVAFGALIKVPKVIRKRKEAANQGG